MVLAIDKLVERVVIIKIHLAIINIHLAITSKHWDLEAYIKVVIIRPDIIVGPFINFMYHMDCLLMKA